MMRGVSSFPSHPSRPDIELAEDALLTVWRTFWLDIPLAWACAMNRLLFRCVQPVDFGDCLFSFNVSRDGEVEDGKRD